MHWHSASARRRRHAPPRAAQRPDAGTTRTCTWRRRPRCSGARPAWWWWTGWRLWCRRSPECPVRAPARSRGHRARRRTRALGQGNADVRARPTALAAGWRCSRGSTQALFNTASRGPPSAPLRLTSSLPSSLAPSPFFQVPTLPSRGATDSLLAVSLPCIAPPLRLPGSPRLAVRYMAFRDSLLPASVNTSAGDLRPPLFPPTEIRSTVIQHCTPVR